MNKAIATQGNIGGRVAAQLLSANLVQRKVGRHHIAFFRANLQGLDIGKMADKYLETGMDLHRAKTTLVSMLGRTEETQWPFRVPQSSWLGDKGTARHQQAWRPFDGALSASSVKFAITIASGLFEWLVRVQYCAFNPWVGVSKSLVANTDESSPDVEFMRAFSVGQWEYLMSYLAVQPTTKQTERLKFVLPFAYSTGLRISELVDAGVGRIYTMPLSGDVGVRWMLKVLGKGAKWRAVPIPSDAIDALTRYFIHRGLNPDIFTNASDTPLIGSLTSINGVTTSALSKSLNGFFGEVANALKADGKLIEAKAFERATVHWLRHTCGSHLALSGVVPINVVQRLLGHASLQTTSIYTDTSDENMWRTVERAGQRRILSTNTTKAL